MDISHEVVIEDIFSANDVFPCKVSIKSKIGLPCEHNFRKQSLGIHFDKPILFDKLVQQLRQSVILGSFLAICKIADDIQLELSSRDSHIEHLAQIFIDFLIRHKQICLPMRFIDH